MKNFKHIIALFFITMMLFFKVAGLHALIHHGEDEAEVQHCEVCHVSSISNFTPLLSVDSPTLPQVKHFSSKKALHFNAQVVVVNNVFLSSYLFTRPPPNLA